MDNNIQLIEVKGDNPEIVALAKSVGHEAQPHLRTIAARNAKTGELLGFIQVVDLPLTISTWKRPGSDTVRAIQKIKKEFTKNTGGVGLTGCNPQSPFYPVMERLGFTKTGLELFFSIEKPDEKPKV